MRAFMPKVFSLLCLSVVILSCLSSCGLYDVKDLIHAREEARDEGYEAGYDDGYYDGYDEGTIDAILNLKDEYRDEYFEEGYSSGIADGYADNIEPLIEKNKINALKALMNHGVAFDGWELFFVDSVWDTPDFTAILTQRVPVDYKTVTYNVSPKNGIEHLYFSIFDESHMYVEFSDFSRDGPLTGELSLIEKPVGVYFLIVVNSKVYITEYYLPAKWY